MSRPAAPGWLVERPIAHRGLHAADQGRLENTASAARYRAGPDRIDTLAGLLDLIGGGVPLICEIKSRFDGDLRLADRVRELLLAYAGPAAVKSFDPTVIAHLRADPPAPLGMVAEATYDDPAWEMLTPALRQELAHMLHFERTQPDFLSYHVGDLPHAVPYFCRRVMGRPVMAWTVRTPAQRACAARWADQMVFEGFVP